MKHKPLKAVLLGDSATQFVTAELKKLAAEKKLNIELFELPFNQIEQQIVNPDSELYAFCPNYVIVFQCTQHKLEQYQKSLQKYEFAQNCMNQLCSWIAQLNERLNATILWNNFYEINPNIFGNYANKTSDSFIYQLRKLNLYLADLAQEIPNLFLYDLCSAQNDLGQSKFVDNRMQILAGMAISMDGTQELAKRVVDVVLSVQGKVKKCLILDLDNTLWGGVIGDDGIENIQIGTLGIGKAFTAMQHWAKLLKERGIILAICSKNTKEIAEEPFVSHPDMVLKLDDIAVFVANWNNKVDNVRYIQDVLNIGFDSMVFVDDNPAERQMVIENIEGISVPGLPEDPAEYVPFLSRLNLFETASYSQADTERTKQYQAETKRVEVKQTFVNETEYLKSLQMTCKIERANKFNIPRIAQLTQRSNQFNLRTQRYTEAQVEQMAKSEKFEVLAFSLSDKFGDNGLVSVLILDKQDKQLFIDTWIMSCRVLKRELEYVVLNKIVNFSHKNGYCLLVGEYLKTPKNDLVKNHYANLGFTKNNKGLWEMQCASFEPKNISIKIHE